MRKWLKSDNVQSKNEITSIVKVKKTNMKNLESIFEGKGEVSGNTFQKIKESENAFLYEVLHKETGTKWYEVFQRKIQKAGETMMAGVKVNFEEKERYPKTNDFGVWAWCYKSLIIASIKFQELSTTK
jgi:hypothetical protein